MGNASDSLNPSNIWAAGKQNIDPSTSVSSPSRLTESTAALRETLMTRNLYTEFVQYPLQQNDRQKVVNTISTVFDTVAPFSSINIANSVVGRLAKSPTTPLSEIGLIMLGKQLTNNFKSNMGQTVYQNINVKNLFDGNPDTTFFSNRDFRITQKEDAGTLEKFAERFLGYNPGADNPFSYNATNKELVENTGEAQRAFLFGDSKPNDGGLNRNIYKPKDAIYGVDGLNIIKPRSDLVGRGPQEYYVPLGGQTVTYTVPVRKYFDSFINSDFGAYSLIVSKTMTSSVETADGAMDASYYNTSLDPQYGQEYAPNQDFVDSNFGVTKKRKTRTLDVDENKYSNSNVGGEHDDTLNEQIVWGRNGVGLKANEELAQLRGIEDDSIVANNNLAGESGFKVNAGLLEYTRNLLNATEGQVVDQTRKIFNRNGKITGLNGSGLFTAPDNSLFKGAKGLRQHSPLDQYDRFAKAIRFEGNNVYQGNPDSVVYNTVLPRIHPAKNRFTNTGEENKNLTFSLENLAVESWLDDESGWGMIDDGEGTLIPKCEVGPMGGRLMWFPPYIESLNEVAMAKHDTVVMVGRNEPIYTYMHSERTANLSFKLIIDYPEHVKNFSTYREMANFFEFGGEGVEKPVVKPPTKPPPESDPLPLVPEVKRPQPMIFSYPNDRPYKNNAGNPDDPIDYTLIDSLYNNVKYDIKKGLDNTDDTNSFRINDKVFLLTGITEQPDADGKYFLTVPPGFTQSGARYVDGLRKLDDNIYEVFNAEDNYKYYEIVIVGSATALFTPQIAGAADTARANEHNTALGQRRADAMASFVKQRIAKVLDKSFESTKITILTDTIGEVNPEYWTKDSIPLENAKKQRVATINFVPRETGTEPKEEPLTSEEQREKAAQAITDQNAESTKNQSKKNDDCYMTEREIGSDAILNDFKALTKNYFYPAFHSQTPEDFHKRLTFLQQCVRQGSAIRSNPEVDDQGITRAKNSVFGRQPVCVLRIGDFFYTKVIIDNITIDYETIWDTNPEGMGMQPMVANVTLQMMVIGGQSLKGPVDALQNAVAYNYYANSTFAKNGEKGTYTKATQAAEDQEGYNKGIKTAKDLARKNKK